MKATREFIAEIKTGNFLSIARALTVVENDLEGSSDLLLDLTTPSHALIIGVTGPPGAGKSTLVSKMISLLDEQGKRIAVLAVDPTSPFNLGSLLGDRIRMSSHYNKSGVFIRSVATRGSLGGVSTKIIEMTTILQAAGFDYIIVETVGVGQSEIEIAGLADVTIVVLVPEAGDDIQHIKSGLMEIGDAFVVNKSDREGAEAFRASLLESLHQRKTAVPVFSIIADKNKGVTDLLTWMEGFNPKKDARKICFYAEKAYKLIQDKRMKDVRKADLERLISLDIESDGFNLYRFVQDFEKS